AAATEGFLVSQHAISTQSNGTTQSGAGELPGLIEDSSIDPGGKSFREPLEYDCHNMLDGFK
ncbi:MAG: hypothetical protein ACRD9L_01330, partial [Bryobacteraceae bacterium]